MMVDHIVLFDPQSAKNISLAILVSCSFVLKNTSQILLLTLVFFLSYAMRRHVFS